MPPTTSPDPPPTPPLPPNGPATPPPPRGEGSWARKILNVYLGAVVLPLSLGLWAAAYLRAGEVQRLRFEEDQRMGAAAVYLLQRDLDEVSQGLIRRARPLPGADRELPGVQAALAGDTVLQVMAVEDRLEVTVLLPGSGAGVAFASGPFTPRFVDALGESVGYDAALYVNRVRRASTDEAFGPDTLPIGTNRRLTLFPDGMPLRLGERGASLHPRERVRGRAPEVAVLVSPVAPRPPALSGRVPLLSALLALALSVGGWLLLEYRPAGSPGDPWRGRRSLTLVWLPLALVLVSLAFMARTFPAEARRGTVQELARAMALARSEWERLSPEEIRSLTGFPVTVTGPDGVEVSTLPHSATEPLATLPPPPSAYAISGRMGEGREETLYVSARLGGDRTLILTAAGPEVRLRGLGLRLAVLGAGLAVLVVIFPVIRYGGAFPPPRNAGPEDSGTLQQVSARPG